MYKKNYTKTEERQDKHWCYKSTADTSEVLQEMWKYLIVGLQTETLIGQRSTCDVHY